MIETDELLTIKEASEWATNHVGRNVTPANISYLVRYGRVRKIDENGSTFISRNDLNDYYRSFNGSRETDFKESTPVKTDIRLGDSKEVLKEYPDNLVDLIVTSPPYADRRKNTYGGVSPDEYVEWFLPISKELLRVLKPDGTFILNIKEKAENGERNTYVLELILALRKQGWLWTEEFVWHKKNSYPGRWPNRFRDSWERLLQFNKTKKFNMYQDAVRVPIGDWANGRLKNLSQTDKIRDNAKNGSGFGKNISNWLGKETVYPTNVLHLSTECNNKNHSAAFPDALPEWFIKLFTKENDVVLDPFAGSGTTLRVAKRMARNSIGIEIVPEYVELVKSQIAQEPLNLF
jgi:site-specific DNA-methyltransferase (adenine-specific)/site-specific DNA-methyltransferase (cytosine-N4-specific)